MLDADGERMGYKRKLIEVALPLDAISRESARDPRLGQGHPRTLHLWWARKPLAAVRAVLWASLVDDPSAHPDRFPTEGDQAVERQRLFEILERLVVWKNSNNPEVLAEARAEIVDSCGGGGLPNVLDPFCGGGTIPLEAQRLGLPAYGGDLNPVATLISKGLVEIPPRFAGLPPINPEARSESGLKTWQRAQGLAEDITFYGKWMRDRAFERIGHLYPKVSLPAEAGGGEADVIAWIWARTVLSPDPSWDGHVPLVRSWVLRKPKHNKPLVWAEPMIDRTCRRVTYRIREGGTPPKGTMARTAAACSVTGTPVSRDYIKAEALAGRLRQHLIAVVAEGRRKRVYVPPVDVPHVDRPADVPTGRLSTNSQYMGTPLYGMTTTASLFTDRQLVALSTFSNLLGEVRRVVDADAREAGLVDDRVRLRDRGAGVAAYADAISTYLAFAVDRCASLWANLTRWNSTGEKLQHIFGRQALSMVWNFAEANPFSNLSGNWSGQVGWVQKALAAVPAVGVGEVLQGDAPARVSEVSSPVVCTDPPYYDNVPYADLSDFFYVWLRHNLSDVWPEETATMLTPKADELVANPHRAKDKQDAKQHFEQGMARVWDRIAVSQHPGFPATVFYAFKQQETKHGEAISTGWETFLQGLVNAGLQVTATWPIRTEMSARLRAMDSAAMASSIVIACRQRPVDASLATRREFLDALHAELPRRTRLLQDQAIAPVDMAQSAMGPGMEVFSRYAKVLEAEGTPMPVRTALALINEVLEEVLSEEETEFDGDTRWAITWYDQFGHEAGPFGDAETLSKAKNTSVAGVVQAGIAESRAGKVRLLTRAELDPEWDPVEDKRPTVWEITQHLIACLEESETAAADLLRKVGGNGDRARRLAYLLYQIADRRGRSADAVAYNTLIRTWHDLARLAAAQRGPTELTLEGM